MNRRPNQERIPYRPPEGAEIEDLFSRRPEQIPPYSRGSDTSRTTAILIADGAETQRAHVLAAIRASGTRGKTCDELEEELGTRHSSTSSRIWELKADPSSRYSVEGGPLIWDSGNRRRTRSGHYATVWTAIRPGEDRA